MGFRWPAWCFFPFLSSKLACTLWEMADTSISESGGFVHHYNIYGQQHHRNPFRDKSGHVTVSPDPRWHRDTTYNSRTELQQARKQWRVPHKSYDLDGDGHVGQRDYFIGKHF